MTVEYKCIDVYKKPENPMEWLPCPRCGLRLLVWEFDNGRSTACGCGTDCYRHRRYIEIDEEYALMTKQTFEGLREYSVTIPSGEYEGKMWKANRGGIWYLYWYDHDDNPSMIKIERREILLLN